jgi:hypothetical protein
MEKQMKDFKLPDGLMVRRAKAIVGAILVVIVLFLADYLFWRGGTGVQTSIG